jgi:hypothetical protein
MDPRSHFHFKKNTHFQDLFQNVKKRKEFPAVTAFEVLEDKTSDMKKEMILGKETNS